MDLHFIFQKATSQIQICIPFYIRYSRCLPNSLFYVSQLYLCTTGITHYKIECKEKQILNRVLTRNLILKCFAPFPSHCTSLLISRDSQRTEIRINHYKTTNYTHFSKKQSDYILAQKTRFSARNQPVLALKNEIFLSI